MRPHDAAYKLLFSFPDMVRDLLGGFVPREWTDALDLSTLERWPESTVSDDLRQRHQDRVWRVRLRERWLYVLVLLEFQSAVDRTMAVRILGYTALLYQDLLRASSEPLAPVLPIVLYDGVEEWTAAMEVAGLSASAGEHLAPYQPSQRYVVLDVRGYTGVMPRGRNRVASLIRMARSRGFGETAAGVRRSGRVAAGAGARGADAGVLGVAREGARAGALSGVGAAGARGLEGGGDDVEREGE